MATTDILINDTPLTRYGFTVMEGLDGWRDAAVGSRPSDDAPGLAGRVLLDSRAQIPARQVTVPGFIRASSLSALLVNHHLIKALCAGARVELRFADDLTKVLACELVEARFPGVGPRLINNQARCRLRFEALDPYWYDRQPLLIAAPAATRARCPLGTAPTAPVLQVLGSATNPVITLRNQAGDSIGTLTWTGTLAATDSLEIDCAARTARKIASGTPSDAVAGLSGSFLILAPDDAGYALSSWATLEVSAGTLVASYCRGWI